MTKILTIVGARPQFIKAATVSRAIKQIDNVEEVIVHTGQHFDSNMSDIFFEELRIPKPNYNLEISSLGHGAMTGRMLEGIEEIIVKEKPDWVLVYGDTNSTLAGALAASKLHVKVAHVEAGLRSFNMKMPEEQNRILTDRLSTILFCPTDSAVNNLKNEGYDAFDIAITNIGDVMYDAALFYKDIAKEPSWFAEVVGENKFALSTIHRAENTDDPKRLAEIVKGLNELHASGTPVVLPLHPRTRNILKKEGFETHFHIVEPVGYLEMVYLLDRCSIVVSDSGGVQKEAYFFKKPCLVMRDDTEWTELIEHGTNKMVGANAELIFESANNAMNSEFDFSIEFYGDGSSAEKIVKRLHELED